MQHTLVTFLTPNRSVLAEHREPSHAADRADPSLARDIGTLILLHHRHRRAPVHNQHLAISAASIEEGMDWLHTPAVT
jgi:hypothetical protein